MLIVCVFGVVLHCVNNLGIILFIHLLIICLYNLESYFDFIASLLFTPLLFAYLLFAALLSTLPLIASPVLRIACVCVCLGHELLCWACELEKLTTGGVRNNSCASARSRAKVTSMAPMRSATTDASGHSRTAHVYDYLEMRCVRVMHFAYLRKTGHHKNWARWHMRTYLSFENGRHDLQKKYSFQIVWSSQLKSAIV